MNILVYSPDDRHSKSHLHHMEAHLQEMQEVSSTLHPNYTGLPQLTQNSFELLQHSAAAFAVHVIQLVLSLGQWWGTVRKGWAQTRTVLPFPHLSPVVSLSLCRPQSSTIASRGRSCLIAHFIHWRLGLIALMQGQEPENPCAYKTDCSTKSFTSLEQFTSPFCLSFPVCKSEIMFTFLPGILQGLIS